MSTDMLEWSFVACLALTVVILVAAASSVTPLERPKYGYRGAERRRAIEARGIFAVFEPFVRFTAALIAPLLGAGLRVRLARELQRADDILGLVPEEFVAISLMSSALLGAIAAGLMNLADVDGPFLVPAIAFGLALPAVQVREVIRRRTKEITRALPPAIEIAAMCMSAGSDFPGAIRMLAGTRYQTRTPLSRELSVILENLELGQTRKHALEGFAERVPSRPVREFVQAVIQAEQKGNPLARVLQVQGRMLNMRRSVAAEEAAARAGVFMIIPMVLLVAAILLLLMGPFVVKGIGW